MLTGKHTKREENITQLSKITVTITVTEKSQPNTVGSAKKFYCVCYALLKLG